jgi:hypothetical protein
VFGREGDHVLLNGRKAPVLRLRSGAPQRWRIVNTACSRFFLLDLRSTFTVIGSDGAYGAPTTAKYCSSRPASVWTRSPRPPARPVRPPVYSMLYNRGYGAWFRSIGR